MAVRVRTWFLVLLPTAAVVLAIVLLVAPPTSGPTQAFRIPSASMEPTLLTWDCILVYILPGYPPHRGGLIVHLSVEEEGLKAIKRVVGVPGDTLAMVANRSNGTSLS